MNSSENKIIFKSSAGMSVWSDWFDIGDGRAFRLLYLKMYEELGGKIAYGEMKLFHAGNEAAMKSADRKCTGHITLFSEPFPISNAPGENGISTPILEIDFFVVGRSLIYNELTIKFLCLPKSDRVPAAKDFITKLNIAEYSNITSALESLYPGKIEIRCKSDLNNDIQLVQSSESDYDFCKKLAYSFKKDSIFTFGFEGFLIKDLIGVDHRGNDETNMEKLGEIVSGAEITQIDPYNQTYNNLLYSMNETPWDEVVDETRDKFMYGEISKYHKGYSIVAKEYSELIKNYLRNQALMSGSLLASFRLVSTTYPNFKIGDVVKYRNITDSSDPNVKATNFSKFLVKSNELFISTPESSEVDADGLNFSWTTKLLAVDNVYGTMPTEDPANLDTNDE